MLGIGGYRFRNVKDEKTYIHLKFTESGQKAFDEYFQLPQGHRKKCPIMIASNGLEQGIKIPQASKPSAFFKFIDHKKANDGPGGSFECLYESHMEVISKGSLNSMKLQATNDSFENTRQSMANIIAKNDKNCVKELKSSGGVVRHRPTRPRLVAPPRKKCISQSLNNSSPPVMSTSMISKTISNNTPKAVIRKPQQQNPALMRKPIRERIIQLLALRPMKKPELIQRLHTDGIKESEKKNISMNLTSVSAIKDNCHILLKHLWSEVLLDWTFYSEAEKILVKKNKLSGASPPPVVMNQPKIVSPTTNKRIQSDPYEHSRKRARIEHKSSEAVGELKRSPSNPYVEISAGSSMSSPVRSKSPFEVPAGGVISTNISNGDEINTSNGDIYCHVPTSRLGNLSNYEKLFPPIRNRSDRHNYRIQFEEIYCEYSHYFHELNDYKNKYAIIEKELTALLGTPEFEIEKNRIENEYDLIEPIYMEKKKRYDFLHSVLAHLKTMVADCDAHL